MKKILVIDNYDSFTYNLVHLIEKVAADVQVHVVLNDEVDLSAISTYDGVVLSPGPGIPEEAGRLLEVIREFRGKVPILGVCLGHQAIGVESGAKLINLEQVFHGVSTPIKVGIGETILFRNVPSEFAAGRYHSWVIDEQTLPAMFTVSARDQYNNIMAIELQDEMIYGVQFHPESIMTDYGELVIRNFLTSK